MSLRYCEGVVTAMIGLLSISAAQAGNVDFTLVNGTGYDIQEVYISAAARNRWGSDRLGDGLLAKHKSRLFTFSDKANCKQDIKVVFKTTGNSYAWDNLDLCVLNKITLKYNPSKRTVWAVTE